MSENIEDQIGIIGAIISSENPNEAFCESKLISQYFTDMDCREIYHAMIRLDASGETLDRDTVQFELRKEQRLFDLVNDCCERGIVARLENYANELRSAYRTREIQNAKIELDKIDPSSDREDFDAALERLNRASDDSDTGKKSILDTIQPVNLSSLQKANKPREQLLYVENNEKKIDYLPKGKTGLLVARGGCGKTQALAQLGFSIATGIDWLDTFKVTKPGKVALLLGEEDQEEIERRLKYIIGHERAGEDETRKKELQKMVSERLYIAGLLGQDVSLISGENKRDRGNEGAKTAFATSLIRRLNKMGPWDLIVLDPLSRFAGPDSEKDNFIATRFIEACEELTTISGNPTVIVASHVSKQDTKDGENLTPRGSSAFYDGARWVASMVPDKENGTVKYNHAKSNYTAQHDAIILTRSTNGFLHVPGSGAGKSKSSKSPFDQLER